MVPTTWTALLLLVVAVLPGAMFTFGFERQVSAYGATLADRVLRFVAVSVVFDLLYAWPAYLAYQAWLDGEPVGAGQFAVAWLGVAATTGVPAGVGWALGGLYSTRRARDGWEWIRRWLPPEREKRLLDLALGATPAPRAWDDLFSHRPTAYLRILCTNGRWVGGAFGEASYAGGFPNEADLVIEEAWPIDADGMFGEEPFGYALYVPSASIAHVEVVARAGREEES
ncbi:MAG TPA: DUF6338 family protein [Frankiaceae bacterium]|nr:DUF6338 family protein [Frankiaceae bacterium]